MKQKSSIANYSSNCSILLSFTLLLITPAYISTSQKNLQYRQAYRI